MPRIVFFIGLLLSSGTVFAEEDCDCTIFPFEPDPPCFEECSGKLLAIATAEQLEEVMRIDENVSRRIAALPDDELPKTLEEYKKFLPGDAFKDLRKRLRSLKSEQFEEIRDEARERGENIESLWEDEGGRKTPETKSEDWTYCEPPS